MDCRKCGKELPIWPHGRKYCLNCRYKTKGQKPKQLFEDDFLIKDKWYYKHKDIFANIK